MLKKKVIAMRVCWSVILVVVSCASSSGSAKNRSGSGAVKKIATAKSGTEWRTHKDPAGFSVEIPTGWRVKVHAKSGRIDLTGDAGKKVTLLPFFVSGKTDVKLMRTLLQVAAKDVAAGAKWSPEPVGKSTYRVTGKAGSAKWVAALVWVPSTQGTAGYCYATTAPERTYAQSMDEIDRRRSNTILEVVDVVDPETGKEYKVEYSSNYSWIDHRGNIVGTETYTVPNIDFRELIALP